MRTGAKACLLHDERLSEMPQQDFGRRSGETSLIFCVSSVCEWSKLAMSSMATFPFCHSCLPAQAGRNPDLEITRWIPVPRLRGDNLHGNPSEWIHPGG